MPLTMQDIQEKRARLQAAQQKLAALRQKVAQLREMRAMGDSVAEDFLPAEAPTPLPQSRAPMDVVDPVTQTGGGSVAPADSQLKREAQSAYHLAAGIPQSMVPFDPQGDPNEFLRGLKGMGGQVLETLKNVGALSNPGSPEYAKAIAAIKDRTVVGTLADLGMVVGAVEGVRGVAGRLRGGARPAGRAMPAEEVPPVRPEPTPVAPRPVPTEQYAAPAGPPTQVKQYQRPIGPKAEAAVPEPAKPFETIEAPPPERFSEPQQSRANYDAWLESVIRRDKMEARGQEILDMMEESGKSPRSEAVEFWENTYDRLPDADKRIAERMLRGQSGMEPGGTIATQRMPDGSVRPIIAESWKDIGREFSSDLPATTEYLQGTERGYVVRLAVANEAMRHPTPKSLPRLAAPPERIPEPGKTIPEAPKPLPSNEIAGGGKMVGEKQPWEMTRESRGHIDPDLSNGVFKTKRGAVERLNGMVDVIENSPQSMAILDDFGMSPHDVYQVSKHSKYNSWGISRTHQHDVAFALSKGKPVPPEVLADYPDLAAKYGKAGKPPAPEGQLPPKVAAGEGQPRTTPTAISPLAEGKLTRHQIGDEVRVAGIDKAIVNDVTTVGGVDYELYGVNSLKDKRGAVRIIDLDSGEVVTVKTFPSFDMAEKFWRQAVEGADPSLKGKSASEFRTAGVRGKLSPAPSSAPKVERVIDDNLKALGEDQGSVQQMSGGLGGVIGKVSREVTPKFEARGKYTPEQVRGSVKEVSDFFDRSEKAPSAPRRIAQAVVADVKKKFLTFPELRGPKKELFADARNELRLLADVQDVSARKAVDAMRGVLGRLDKSQVDLLRRKVFIEDLLETESRGLALPEGLDQTVLAMEKSRIDGLLKSDPDLSAAYTRHKSLWDAITDDLVGRGKLDRESAFKNYIHHDVLDYFAESGLGVGGKLRSPKRGYLKQRFGSEKDILTDYLAVQYRSLSRLFRDNAIDDGLTRLAERYHQAEAPGGYVEWSPGISISGGKSVPGQTVANMTERLVNQLPPEIRADVAALLESESGKPIRRFNIPRELAETLDNFRDEVRAPIGGMAQRLTSGWKQLMLNKNPIRYNRRNLIGDFERAANVMPQAFGKDGAATLKRSVKEVFDAARGKYSDDYKLAMENDVVGTGEIAREIGELRSLEEFRHLADGKYAGFKHPLRTAGKWLRDVSVTRENILRYHVFKYNLERMRAGKPILEGVSDVRGMTDQVKAIGKVARESLGDYGALTPFEKSLRRGLVPFYSWLKINTQFWPMLFTRRGGTAAVSHGIAKGIGFGARKVAQASAIYAAAYLWNTTMQEEQEGQLPKWQRERFHINTGVKDDKGQWITITEPTALSDFMETIGLHGIDSDVRQLLNGQLSAWDFAAERVKRPVNALAQRITPAVKAPVEAVTKRQFFPDVFEPRPGPGGLEGLAEGAGVGEFVSGKGLGRYAETFKTPQIYGGRTSDPMMSALGDISELSRDFRQKHGYENEGGAGPSTENNRAFFNALANNDMEAAREVGPKIDPDSFAAYLRARHPIESLPTKLRQQFFDSLSADDKERLWRAVQLLEEIRAKAGI